MSTDIFLALVLFALASSVTPGPNNLMLMTSGVNFGFKRTIPHMLGVSLGFVFMAILVGIGVMKLFDAFPVTYLILKVFSVTYMLYLAYKIANSSSALENKRKKAQAMTFVEAVLFQWVNPKAWTMALTAVSIYAPTKEASAVVLVACIFGMVNFPCIACWAGLGTKIKLLLVKPKSLRIFNYFMATVLVLSMYPIIFGDHAI